MMLQSSKLLVLRSKVASQNASRRLDSMPYSSWLGAISLSGKPTPPTMSGPAPGPAPKPNPSPEAINLSAPLLMFHVKDIERANSKINGWYWPCYTSKNIWYNRCFLNIQTEQGVTKKMATSNLNSNSGHELPQDIKVVGSSHGWLVVVNPCDCSLYLSNPLAPHETIKLPSIETLQEFRGTVYKRSDDGTLKIAGFKCRDKDNKESEKSPEYLSENFIGKVILSSSLKSEDCTVVLATHGEHSRLAFCKISDDKWTNLESSCCFGDVIYSSHEKKVYAISNCDDFHIEAWDLNDPNLPKKTSYLPPIRIPDGIPLRANCFTQMYLVESMGEILVVAKFSGWHIAEDGNVMTSKKISWWSDESEHLPYKTYAFSVLKFDPVRAKFEEVKSLGDRALFLGINHSFAATTTNFPALEPNVIYFSDDYQGQKPQSLVANRGLDHAQKGFLYGAHDVGRYGLEDKSFITHYSTASTKHAVSPVFIALN